MVLVLYGSYVILAFLSSSCLHITYKNRITATVATVTEHSSSNALAALAQLTDPHTHAIRNGVLELVRTPELVVGDIVELGPGDLVPGDIRVLEAHSVKVNEMILTGESADVTKKEISGSSEICTKLTLTNMAYSSTSVVEGKIRGVVMLTGMQTRVGSIAALLGNAGADDSKEQKKGDVPQAMTRRMSMNADTFEAVVDEEDSEDEAVSDDEEESAVAAAREKEPMVRRASRATMEVVTETVTENPYAKFKKWIESFRPKTTPLQDELHNLGMVMTTFALTGATAVVVIGIFRGFRDPNNDENAAWLQSLMLAVSMAVSAIPEGLPLVVVICLALGTNAMAERNTLIRRLPAVETLGSASVICSDKTGTLTSGKMTATDMWTMGHGFRIKGEGYDPTTGGVYDGDDERALTIDHFKHHSAVAATLGVTCLCNDAETRRGDDGRWKPIGTSTEAALVVASEKFGLEASDSRVQNHRVFMVPFSSSLKMMATVHKLTPQMDSIYIPNGAESAGELAVLVKGAPNYLLKRCTSILQNRDGAAPEIVPLTETNVALINEHADALSDRGLRVLAVAYRRMSELPEVIRDDEDGELSAEARLGAVANELVFAGLVGMMDPPRKGVKKAIARARSGGIRTVMITGDYLKTAVAIAKMITILQPEMDADESAVDCSALRPDGPYLSHREIDAITWHSFVFARARPEDKIEIVKSFQRQGFVAAMTGDGVNDAPALRQANIGVAMGIAGSEVAKAASDMILTDDKFSSIVEAVELGRTIYSNLRKFVMYLIGTNWSQVLVILVAVLVGMPSPLEPLQILFINLITDGTPAIALSIEGPEKDVMKDAPRQKNEKILSGVIIRGILGHAVVLVSLMLFMFVIGLWWNTGRVLLDKMYDEDDELITQCKRLTEEGTWHHFDDKDCIKDGLAYARSMVFLTISFSESLRPLTARSFSTNVFHDIFRNTEMICAIAFSISMILLITFVPGVNTIFHLKPPHWYEWLIVCGGVIATVATDEYLKVKYRSQQEDDSRWKKSFDQLRGIAMELRNVRSHVTKMHEHALGSVPLIDNSNV